MVVDIHSHFWIREHDLGPEVLRDIVRSGGNAESADALLNVTPEKHRAGTSGADRVVVFGLRAARCGFHVSNDHVAAYVATDARRLIGFGSADPVTDSDPLAEIRRCVEELGMRGVKLGPTYQGVPPDDPRLMEIYAYAQRHRLPVLLHQGTTFAYNAPLKYANPVLIEDIAYQFPELKIIIAHMGHPWMGECISLIRKQPNVYADISALYYRPWQFYNGLKLAEEYGADKKLLFGTDFPFTTVQSTRDALLGMNDYAATHHLPPLNNDVLTGILHRNAVELLGLEESRPKERVPCA